MYSITHSYDPTGNRFLQIDGGTRTTFVYDSANQLRSQMDSSGRTTFSFDAAGNQLIEIPPTGARTTFAWDGENRMTEVLLPAGARNTFIYNGDGDRVRQDDSTGTAQFVWDWANVLQETDGLGMTQVEYTMDLQGYGALLSQRRSATSSFCHFDGLGSTDRLTNASGLVTDRYLYEVYGSPRLISGSTTNRFRFGGRWGYAWNPDLLNYWLRAREYDPALARFLSQDPVRDMGINQYWYADGNPVNRIDPPGLNPVLAVFTCIGSDLCRCIVGAAGAGTLELIYEIARGQNVALDRIACAAISGYFFLYCFGKSGSLGPLCILPALELQVV